MLITIRELFDELNKNNIIYCHWKSNEHLSASFNAETDLDVLFDFRQRKEIEKVFNKCNLKRFRATPLMQYNGIEDYIGFDKETAKIWHLHTHYRLTLGEKHLKGYTVNSWANLILKNRIIDSNDVYISRPEDELILLICRISLKLRYRDILKNVGNDDIAEIEWLLKRVNKNKLLESAQYLLDENIACLILELIKNNYHKKRKYFKLQKKLRKKLKMYTGNTTISSYITRTKRELFWVYGGIKRKLGLNSFTAKRRISPMGGIVISFLGCDGAGKSTILSYVKKELNKKLDVTTIYFGSGDGSSSIIRRPMKLIANKVGGKGVRTKVENEYKAKKISLKSRLYSFAKIVWAITLAKEKKKKLHQMTKARNNGIIVLTDRYPQSEFFNIGDGPLLQKYSYKKGILKRIADWEMKIYESAQINKPDLAIKLIVSTPVAIVRKPEMSVDEIEQKKSIVTKINISDNNMTIDTTAKEINETLGEVIEKIWEMI